MTGMVYVCDRCGHIEVSDPIPENGEWDCEVCGSNAVWEFPPERMAHAQTHSLHIQRGLKSGLFRGAA